MLRESRQGEVEPSTSLLHINCSWLKELSLHVERL